MLERVVAQNKSC